ncbi:hypothetical protein JTE90_015874 [Oedothorax gibbosus]|uniref:Uncharacterized protein n=1 Tax=Oedothorax gibbosus TaxID=931172 RepID=A0AAV6VUY4_9ARAC|nr:hypothetical protein JTE90_015874 [Oedothorax gibbosus]
MSLCVVQPFPLGESQLSVMTKRQVNVGRAAGLYGFCSHHKSVYGASLSKPSTARYHLEQRELDLGHEQGSCYSGYFSDF